MSLNATGYNNPIEALNFIDAQTTSNGFPVFGIVFMLMITVVIFLAMNGQTSGRRFAVTFAIMGIISFLGYLIGFVTIAVFTFYVVAFVLTASFLRTEANK